MGLTIYNLFIWPYTSELKITGKRKKGKRKKA